MFQIHQVKMSYINKIVIIGLILSFQIYFIPALTVLEILVIGAHAFLVII
ncbi:hypothetical protein KJ570_01885 [Patescibacteria group bacterium]|nr:hypothetical protein [Patescibacteria group bacterium]MBU2036582.1 hypothetical protein [Patescibacteria group bacterium]